MYEVAQQRTVFYVKHVVTSLQQDELPPSVHTEIHRSLAVMLPQIKDIYESFWSDIINNLIHVWSRDEDTSDDDLPLIHATLRLCATLRALTTQEPNDDLLDYWSEKQALMADGLVNLMKHQAGELSQLSRVTELSDYFCSCHG